MGQKIKPTLLRVGVTKPWSSKWLPKKFKFSRMLQEDYMIRQVISEKIEQAGIDIVEIEKTANNYRITIKAAKPGLIIGRGGKGIEDLTKLIENKLSNFRKKNDINEKVVLSLNIEEIKRYDVSAPVTAQNIAWDVKKRLPFRRTMKKYLERIMQTREVLGAKIRMSGRLDGAEIARTECLSNGKLPLQTLRADIDYGEATSFTTFGTIGIKVWIYKGEILNENKSQNKRK